jgi:predicted nucleic acid-binding protein
MPIKANCDRGAAASRSAAVTSYTFDNVRALRANCATLFSEDFQHGQKIERLTIRNPFIE